MTHETVSPRECLQGAKSAKTHGFSPGALFAQTTPTQGDAPGWKLSAPLGRCQAPCYALHLPLLSSFCDFCGFRVRLLTFFGTNKFFSREIFKNCLHTYMTAFKPFTERHFDHVGNLHKSRATYMKQHVFTAKKPSSAINLLLFKQFPLTFPKRNFLFHRRNKKFHAGNKSF